MRMAGRNARKARGRAFSPMTAPWRRHVGSSIIQRPRAWGRTAGPETTSILGATEETCGGRPRSSTRYTSATPDGNRGGGCMRAAIAGLCICRSGTRRPGGRAIRAPRWRPGGLLRRQHHRPATLHDVRRDLRGHAFPGDEGLVRPFGLGRRPGDRRRGRSGGNHGLSRRRVSPRSSHTVARDRFCRKRRSWLISTSALRRLASSPSSHSMSAGRDDWSARRAAKCPARGPARGQARRGALRRQKPRRIFFAGKAELFKQITRLMARRRRDSDRLRHRTSVVA